MEGDRVSVLGGIYRDDPEDPIAKLRYFEAVRRAGLSETDPIQGEFSVNVYYQRDGVSGIHFQASDLKVPVHILAEALSLACLRSKSSSQQTRHTKGMTGVFGRVVERDLEFAKKRRAHFILSGFRVIDSGAVTCEMKHLSTRVRNVLSVRTGHKFFIEGTIEHTHGNELMVMRVDQINLWNDVHFPARGNGPRRRTGNGFRVQTRPRGLRVVRGESAPVPYAPRINPGRRVQRPRRSGPGQARRTRGR